MINKKIEEALNKQINEELYSAYLYMSMASHFDAANLQGLGNWMKTQAEEEMAHAYRFYHYINERGGRAKLGAIAAPPVEWASPLKAFQDALEHERHITSCINALMDLAISEKDHATNLMLQWYVNEQVEEEAIAGEIIEKIKLVGDSGQALYLLDKELGVRVPAMAAALTAAGE